MSLKSHKLFSLSAAVASVLVSGAGAFRIEAANVDNTALQISGATNTSDLLGQIYSLPQPNVLGAEPTLSLTERASTNFTAEGFPTLSSALNQIAGGTDYVSGYSNVNFNNSLFGTGAPFNVAPYFSPLEDNIVARWSGYIELPAGVTKFAMNSNDGSVIYVDGVRVVNNNLYQSTSRRIGQTVSFATAGRHEIVVAYYEGTSSAGVEARYAPGVVTTDPSDGAFTIIPVVDGSSNQILTGVQNSVLAPVVSLPVFVYAWMLGFLFGGAGI